MTPSPDGTAPRPEPDPDPDPDPEPRQELRDDGGRVVATYRRAEHHDGLLAVDVRPADGRDVAAAADAVMARLQGWTVAATGELAPALESRGAVVRRRLRTMVRDLRAEPPPARWALAPLGPGVAAVPVDRPAAEILPAWRAAYTVPGHPDDVYAGDEQALADGLLPLLAGAWGAVLPWSRLAVDAGDRVVAGVVVLAPDGLTPMPWVGDVFRRPGPEHAGLGTALLRRVLALGAAAGVAEAGLSVTDGNPAGLVYERLGFRTTAAVATVRVP